MIRPKYATSTKAWGCVIFTLCLGLKPVRSSDDGVPVVQGETGPFSWPPSRHENIMKIRNSCLQSAIVKRNVDYVWILDGDILLTEPKTLQLLISVQQTVVAPVLRAPNSNYSNFWGGVNDLGFYVRTDDYIPILHREQMGIFTVPMVLSCFLVDLSDPRVTALTFDADDFPFYNGLREDIFVFAESARQEMIDFHIINTHRFGYIFEPMDESDSYLDYVDTATGFIAAQIEEYSPGFLHTPLLKPQFPEPSKLGLDEIYVVNLGRRVERMRRMRRLLNLLGVKYTHWPAVDGQTLDETQLSHLGVKQLPEYLDPYHKRPLKMGEVGCFLSHHSIWNDVRSKGHEIILLLEDDPKFISGFARILADIVHRLKNDKEFEWDLIYLGGKNMDSNFTSEFVNTFVHPYLATTGYNYWTIGYLLSSNGAKKLLAAEPLSKMIALDEFLPIMYDRHPNEDWKRHFPTRVRECPKESAGVQNVPVADRANVVYKSGWICH